MSVIPNQTYKALVEPGNKCTLTKTEKPLFGPGGGRLSAVGEAGESLKKGA